VIKSSKRKILEAQSEMAWLVKTQKNQLASQQDGRLGNNKIEIDKSKLNSLVECPVCTELPRNGPIHHCRNGHIVCDRCKPELLDCPTCHQPIYGRSLKTEQLLELVPCPCKFFESGCKTELVPSLLSDHEIECEKKLKEKLIQCPNIDCLTKILPNYLAKHLNRSNECKVRNRDKTGNLTVTQWVKS
jgi:hypothetical protein